MAQPVHLKLFCNAFGIMAPGAGERTALEEDCRTEAGAVLTGHALDIEVADFCHINTGCDFPLQLFRFAVLCRCS
ncbi:hypothetical protein SDC9_147788 [bioreactor metagenome]|uniref:Uncharacterized protein n=1 Tax=bioreactor metagenome TaxID=1076179 RepID=A0A645EH38_9ZZZZ